jgi:hypothetical protein
MSVRRQLVDQADKIAVWTNKIQEPRLLKARAKGKLSGFSAKR